MEDQTPFIFASSDGQKVEWSEPQFSRMWSPFDTARCRASADVVDLRTPPRIVGMDLAKEGSDRMAYAARIDGMQFVCAIPPELGAVTKMEIISGRVVAHTESGIDMIVPRARADSRSR